MDLVSSFRCSSVFLRSPRQDRAAGQDMARGKSPSTGYRLVSGLMLAAIGLGLVPLSAQAASIETRAREAYVMDSETGTVLLEKNADQAMPPASMSKLMTVLLAFEAIKSGRVNLDTSFRISEKSWRKGGSKMFLKVDTRVKLRDLLRGVIIQSGNDAAIAIAEGLAGTEEAFARRMTERAKALGMTGSHFANATGWPDPEQYMTAHDLARLASILINDYPEFYGIFSETEFTFAGIKQQNRNPLLYRNVGADGLKTGHTEEAGYGLTASAKRGDRRIILVVNGLDSKRDRATESEKLLDWAFREYGNFELYAAGQTVVDADLWVGQQATVPLVAPRSLKVTIPRHLKDKVQAKLVYAEPIPTPVVAGEPAMYETPEGKLEQARLEITVPGHDPVSLPLVYGESVGKLGPIAKLSSAVEYLIFGSGK